MGFIPVRFDSGLIGLGIPEDISSFTLFTEEGPLFEAVSDVFEPRFDAPFDVVVLGGSGEGEDEGLCV